MSVANRLNGLADNRFLRAMPPAVLQRVVAIAETTPLERGDVLVQAGAPTPVIYLPDRGLISLVKPMTDGRAVEVGVVGVEGLSGVSALFGIARSPFDAVVQIEGGATRIRTADLKREMEASPA